MIWVYALSGLLSAFAGIIYTSRLNAAEPVIGEFFPLDAIAAVVLGGTLLEGGEGSVVGTMIGALIITVIINGMNLLGIPSLLQSFVLGCVILIMIASQYFGGKLKGVPSFFKPWSLSGGVKGGVAKEIVLVENGRSELKQKVRLRLRLEWK